ncbi:MAG: flagellar FliJ family protein [Pseudomonadota bacterium]|nr:flagellar FliJ family protein [Pseudomonadota bacterium]
MTNLQPLTVLLAQAERQRDLTLADLIKLKSESARAQAQAEQLLLYRRDYEQRWSAQFCREGQIELVRCYQGFIDKLSQAVEQQARIAAHAVMQVERETAIVRGHEMRAAALLKLIERRQGEGRARAARHDQKLTDERASRAAWAALRVTGFGAMAP